MVFLYPYFDSHFFLCFSPLLLFVVTTHSFAKPKLRPRWLAIISCVWLMFCLVLGFLLGMGAYAGFMNPTVMSPEEYVNRTAGGWLFSGFLLIWMPEVVRRLCRRRLARQRGFPIVMPGNEEQ